MVTKVPGGPGGGFWWEQCPARGPGLTHKHSGKCAVDHGGRHAASTCCHCEEDEFDGVSQSANMSAEDIAARLRQVIRVNNIDGEFEPKMITGLGPQGPENGIGRGPLTDGDRSRITFYVKVIRASGVAAP